ncbi:MAG: metalloregulator ArsR/SmtB family transcription factor [Actinomycetota bacterium]|jgi:ArsR family transcriptional regulator|nr:metalloregulator ArsR/SmtB family transcription factor [Actinomycetota bacterium]
MVGIDPALRHELDDLVDAICKGVNDPKRLHLLYALRGQPRTVTQLCALVGAPQSNVSQHLAVLRDRGLVEALRAGNSVIYSLRHPKVLEAIDILRTVMDDELQRRHARAAGRAADTHDRSSSTLRHPEELPG